jgi:hypothetical protein
LESKGGYNEIDLCSAFENGQSELDKFLKQVMDDSKRTSRMPILFWKKDRKPRLVFIRKEDVCDGFYTKLNFYMIYKTWVVINFKDFITLDDQFFFNCKI